MESPAAANEIPEIRATDLGHMTFDEMAALAVWDLTASLPRGARSRSLLHGAFEIGSPAEITHVLGRVIRDSESPRVEEWELLHYPDAGLRVVVSAGPRTHPMPIERSLDDVANAARMLLRNLHRISNLPGQYRQDEFRRMARQCNMTPAGLLAHIPS